LNPGLIYTSITGKKNFVSFIYVCFFFCVRQIC
jgi:hypothetical protein